jgi:DNA-binding CsgD family transcriptional regulator
MDGSSLQRRRREFFRLPHRGLHLEPLVSEVARLLGTVVGFDGWCFLTMDPTTLLPTHRFKDDVFGAEDSSRLAANEYLEDDVNKFADLARGLEPVGVLSEATGGFPHRSARYRDLLEPSGYGAELRAAFVHEGSCWGALQLFREAQGPDYSEVEANFLASVSTLVAEAIRGALLLPQAETSATINAPGLVLIDHRGEVEAITSAAQRWFVEIRTPADRDALLPAVVYALADRARAGTHGSDGIDASPRARVRGRSGTWLALHGSVLEEGPPGRVAIIIEPARPTEIAPLVTQAYGLSKSESRVARLVMAGLSTEEIARSLSLSPYTVQDHLKGIFDKVGVRSRRELVAQVFFQQYLPRIASAPPSSVAPSRS